MLLKRLFKTISGFNISVTNVKVIDNRIAIETNDIVKDLKMNWLFEEFKLGIHFTDYTESQNTLSLSVDCLWKLFRGRGGCELFTVKLDLESGKILRVGR